MLHRVLGSLGFAAAGIAELPGWAVWLILTLVLVAPAYYLLKRFGVGGAAPDERGFRSNGDAIDRLVSGTEEIPEAAPAGHRTHR
jgi:hypothetical protein